MSGNRILFKFCYIYFDEFVREEKIRVTEWPPNLNAALTLATSLFTENVDVEDITLKFNKKDVRSDEDWYELVQCLKAGHEEDSLKNTIRIFTVDVLKRQ